MGQQVFHQSFREKQIRLVTEDQVWIPNGNPRGVQSATVNLNPKCQWGFQDVRDVYQGELQALCENSLGDSMCFHTITPEMGGVNS